ncbi:cysteine-rich CWC family protein [Pseudomonas sp. MM211]|uniref:cysteine-rich CWC family protein n=1 Tax=Pseudomonas sp. MM211 TaxID=2866808 RepID=UPI001CEDE932|nr:cysteine-rich CWC family protein [Pseudomonas sp. MM211]UCJ16457.1 cysteine-rich CWC family protein [Pseudomonas sp. MM211]
MNTSLCPACGQLNRCAQADSDSEVSHCWCFEVKVEPQALRDLPPEALDRACLCPRCAQALPAENS